MISSLKLWKCINPVDVKVNEIPDGIIKLASINDNLFILSANFKLYHGEVDTETNLVVLEEIHDLELLDISSCNLYLYTVSVTGEVHKRNSKLEIISEIQLNEEIQCKHGNTGIRRKLKVRNIYVNKFGQLYITETGELWASGYMPQININSELPKKVTFFDGRHVYTAGVGHDFAIAVVSKACSDDTSDKDSTDETVHLASCPHCTSSSPTSQNENSLTESCPLGLKLHNSYDIETTSTSSKNDSSNSTNDISKTCIDGESEETEEKGIILRNTEAARQFLTRQISWMSSAGEEYLSEKPTRLIKENVTNMATFVYEGVKTVGDKVAILSRHVSGSSDCNGEMELNTSLDGTLPASKEESLWSLSHCTSEQDLSDHGACDQFAAVIKEGSDLLSREVWTWGNIIHGQLGIGDSVRRERPMIITKLSNVGVCKVSVESYHAAVLTLDGRVFIWGRNDRNQVTYENRLDQCSPKPFIISSMDKAKDISCGSFHTVILSNNLKLSYLGKDAQKIYDLYNASNIKQNNTLKIPLYTNVLSSNMYIYLNKMCCNNTFVLSHLEEEQKFLDEMLVVHSTLIKPLLKKCLSITDGLVYEDFCQNFVNLMYATATNIKSMLEIKNNLIANCDMTMFKSIDAYIHIYRKYLSSMFDIISADGLKCLSKVIDVPQCLYKLRPNVQKKDKDSEEQIMYSVFFKPFERLESYLQFMLDCTNQANDDQKFKEIHHKWCCFIEDQQHALEDAQVTQDFWISHGKNIEFLKSPGRRLIRESHKFPIYLTNAGRFSSHYFILLSDVFVHVHGSSPYVHELTTIWIEPQPNENTQQHLLSLKMPEETLNLYTTEPEDKIGWFHTFQNAIKTALRKKDALQPPLIRSASYTFTKAGFLKDAKYTGRWLNGKIHGIGKLEWSDGKIYTGQFSSNKLCGFGRMDVPNVGVYEGQWKDNQENGSGIFSYANMDVYKGHFKDGLPHGHGILRKGNFNTSTASVYIGEWINGSKSGYGVMDDIMMGEKYLGNWTDNKKQGSGLIVTSEGVYYEGTFSQDALTGTGLMIFEDGTHYEGEFRGTGNLNGKGKLSLQSGYLIDGHLCGNWNDGIKITNATFSKAYLSTEAEKSIPKSFQSFCSPVSLKWKALFQYCYQVLGINYENSSKSTDTKKIWHNVAVYLSNTHQHTLRKNNRDKYLENSLNSLDIIPPYEVEKLNYSAFVKLQQYLTKAFESLIHPLGSLLNDLCVAYTTTYGGMTAHPLLLTHAVSELQSITERLYEIVKILFPALPPYGAEYLLKRDESDLMINCQMLLYPIVLPRMYSSIFTLYTLKNKEQELQYWKRLMEWNKHSDYTLMSFLSVDERILNTATGVKDETLTEAIETLQQLKTTFCPTEKLSVILETERKMEEKLSNKNSFGMDHLLPVFLYVVVRARILQLGSELDFIENFMEDSLKYGKMGIMFITLKACYEQILHEKTSIHVLEQI